MGDNCYFCKIQNGLKLTVGEDKRLQTVYIIKIWLIALIRTAKNQKYIENSNFFRQ